MKITDIFIHTQPINNKKAPQVNNSTAANGAQFGCRVQQNPIQNVNFAGKVQCDFLNQGQISLINNSLINNFGDITSLDLKKQIAQIQKTNPNFNEKQFIRNIVSKCEFCNIKDYDVLLDYVRRGHFQLFAIDDIGIGSALSYLQTKRNPKVRIKITKIPFENFPEKAEHIHKKKPAIIISKFNLEKLENLAKTAPDKFFKIVKNTNFIYPHGTLNGINAFSLTGAEEIVQKSTYHACDEKEIAKFLKICQDNINKFSPDKPVEIKFHDVRNIIPYSMDALLHRLKYKHRFFEKHDNTFMPIARIMKKFQEDAGCKLFDANMPESFGYFRDSLLKHSSLYTPIKLNRSLKALHKQISMRTKGKDVVYYLPKSTEPKSFNYILSSYFLINNIPREKLVKDLSTVNKNQIVVVLDDYIGSGKSILEKLNYLLENNIEKNNIILSSIVATKRGLEVIKQHHTNIITNKIISQFDIEKSTKYKNLANETNKKELASVANNYLIGGYNGGLDNFSTFYMTPNNNNNVFFANIAPGFVISSYGIKTAFNTFDETIQKANLDSLTEEDLNEIIEIYKKANALIPECIIRKIAQLTPKNTENFITVLNTYGKITNPKIPEDIATYLKKSLANIDVQKVDNIFLVDNILDVCKYINSEIPNKFFAQMVNELQNPKTNIPDDVLLHFYTRLIEQLKPIKEVKDRVFKIINNLKPEQLIKFNILEDILKISEENNFTLPINIELRLHEVLNNIDKDGISIELLSLILHHSQFNSACEGIYKNSLNNWWEKIPLNIKQESDEAVINYFWRPKLSEQKGDVL